MCLDVVASGLSCWFAGGYLLVEEGRESSLIQAGEKSDNACRIPRVDP